MTAFVHLHCHSEYSILECPNRIDDLIAAAVADNMTALALTDNASMYGAIEFYQKALQHGIRPILGVDAYLTPDLTVKQRWNHRLILLAMSFEGYQQLIKCVSKAHLEGMYYKPRLDLATLRSFSDDIIAISPGGRGPIASCLQAHQPTQARQEAQALKDIYGDCFYLGIQRLNDAYEDLVEQGTIDIATELDIPIVACNDVYTLTADSDMLRSVLFCIQTGKQLDEHARSGLDKTERYFKTQADMQAVFADQPTWIATSMAIANRCQLNIEMEQVLLPRFNCPAGLSSENYLEQLVWEGIDRRYAQRSDALSERVRFELNIINTMKYANYFLIIHDFLAFCTQAAIPVGPGRGSAAGSIVSYALDITKCDPIEYQLLFERFLNPERVSMPDIDIDFCINRRAEVIDYIVKTYGQECVSQIITFGTMQGRAVIRDVGRVLDIPLADVDRIAKLIPATPGAYTSIPEALEQIKELKQVYDSAAHFKELLDVAIQLEGLKRHTSTHAAGVVISRDPLDTIVPLTQNDGQVATQYAMADIEGIGLLKMDILGLRNLTVISDTEALIRSYDAPDFSINTIPYDDQKTYDLLCQGLGIGVFQCESKGMRQLMQDMKPSVFEDIIALLALYRPGPLGSGMVNEFVSNKLGKTQTEYSLPELASILKETYGMIVYQEQVMQIAAVIGGFSLGQADMLRRAMGKKKKDVMDKLRAEFLAGAKKRNINSKKALDVFELCYKFAEYGFNKSHSAAYAIISYQTAYLKAHYPVLYFATLLSSVVANSEKTALYISELRTLNIQLLPPDVNVSQHHFTGIVTPAERSIRFGLGAIKNVGEGAIEHIIAAAPFKDLMDFCMRVDLKQCNKRVLESLIKVGAFDSFGDRSYLLALYEVVMDKATTLIRERQNGQVGLFADHQVGGGFNIDDVHTDDYRIFTPSETLKFEKELLGLYISGHPLDAIADTLKHLKNPISSLSADQHQKIVQVTGLLSDCRRIITRTKKEMLLGTLEDLTGTLTVLVFSDERFEEKAAIFSDDTIVTITGRLRVTPDERSVMCQDIVVLERSDTPPSLYIDIDGLPLDKLVAIKQLNLEFKGTKPVYLKRQNDTIAIHQKYWVVDDTCYQDALGALIGRGRVWVV